VWRETLASHPKVAGVAPALLEAFAVQVARMRDAQARIDAEGLVVADEKGRPIPHPALDLERAAQAEARTWAKQLGIAEPAAAGGSEGVSDPLDEIARRRAARRTGTA